MRLFALQGQTLFAPRFRLRSTVGPRSQPPHLHGASRTPPPTPFAANLPPIRRAGRLHPAVTFRCHPSPGNLQPTPTVGAASSTPPQPPVTPRPRATNIPPPPKELSHAILPKTALPADPRPGRVVRCGRVRAAVQRFLRAAQPHGRRQTPPPTPRRVRCCKPRSSTCSAAAYPPGMPRSRPA